MGAYASWAALNMTHHMTLRYLADLTQTKRDLYKVLGDDITIASETLAVAYQQHIKSLGIDISIPKSIICRSDQPSSAEFAKHVLREGQDLTPLSPTLLKETYEDFIQLKIIDILRELRYSYNVSLLDFNGILLCPPLITSLLKPLNESQRKRVILHVTNPLHDYKITYRADGPSPAVLDKHWTVYDNPWTGKDGYLVNTAFQQCLYEKLTELATKAIQLRTTLRNQGPKIDPLGCSEIMAMDDTMIDFKNPWHPVYWILEDLESSINKVLQSIDQGQQVGTGSLLVDAQLITDIFLNKDIKAWKRRKHNHNKMREYLIDKTMKIILNPTLLDQEEYY